MKFQRIFANSLHYVIFGDNWCAIIANHFRKSPTALPSLSAAKTAKATDTISQLPPKGNNSGFPRTACRTCYLDLGEEAITLLKGKKGSRYGKSTYLEHLILDTEGGFVFLDPHGYSAERIADTIP